MKTTFAEEKKKAASPVESMGSGQFDESIKSEVSKKTEDIPVMNETFNETFSVHDGDEDPADLPK